MEDFFEVLKVHDFISIVRQMPALETEETGLINSGWRRLARDIFSDENLPETNRSCMDGYAVVSRDTFGASEANPAYLEVVCEISIQDAPRIELEAGHCAGIVTGATLPPGADSVVMIEHVQDLGQGTIEVRKPVAPWENVMLKGEDIGRGDLVLGAGKTITPRWLGMLAALGIEKIEVYKRPRVAIISTGDELVDIGQKPGPGYIRDVNSHTLRQMLIDEGCAVSVLGIIRDNEEELRNAFTSALAGHDVVLVSGGSSVGSRDYTIKAMNGISGLEVKAHGLALSPGKPTIFARTDKQCIWGLPGQVASAQVVMLVLVIPFLRHLQGEADPFGIKDEFQVRARLARNLASKYGRQDYVRVRLEKQNQQTLAVPVTGKSGLLKTLVQAHGLIRIAENCEGLTEGEEVMVRLF
ncbi:MAG: gephyrin-like molybdotransferase Glp [Desulfonatronovibrio sp.]